MTATTFDLPLLVVAGFPRTGTTSIYRNLELHPGFATPIRKELNFFCAAEVPPLAQYRQHFRDRKDGQICVDVSPFYSLDPAVAQRVLAAAPHARVVLLVREPAAWMQSVYAQMCGYTPHPPAFVEYLKDPSLANGPEQIRFSLDDGLYRRSISAFSDAFGANLLVIDFAAFEANPLDVLKRVEAFAGAAPYFDAGTADIRAHNSSRQARRSTPFVRRLMAQEALIRAGIRLVPAPLLRRIRAKLYYAGAHEQKPATPADTAEAEIARKATAADRTVYDYLFRDAAIRLGSEVAL